MRPAPTLLECLAVPKGELCGQTTKSKLTQQLAADTPHYIRWFRKLFRTRNLEFCHAPFRERGMCNYVNQNRPARLFIRSCKQPLHHKIHKNLRIYVYAEVSLNVIWCVFRSMRLPNL